MRAEFGGGVYVFTGESATFTNTTIDGNTATTYDGGGITAGQDATLTILNSTITDNGAGRFGGGVLLHQGADATVTNSVVALNTAGTSGADVAETGTPSTLIAGHSFFGTNVAIDTDNGGNINNGGDPLLAALADNGGPVATRGMLPGSVLIDAGDDAAASGLTTDANDNARLSGPHVDIGATEAQYLLVTTASDVVDANDGVLSLREAVALANADPDLNIITFDPGLTGDTITLTGGELALTDDVIINGDVNGDHKADITISGNGSSRVFHVSGSGIDVELDSLTLTNGHATAVGGAILTGADTTLTVVDTTVENSSVLGEGAGIASYGTLIVTGSTLSGNTAGLYGGGVYVTVDQSATFTNTTIDGNTATTYDGGGITAGQDATLTILNSTITDNGAGRFGGGVHLFQGATATVTNSVVALNTAGTSGADVAETGTPSTLIAGHSFFGTNVAIDTDNGGNINNGGDPLLAALADNGGPVATRSPLDGSSLIGAGDNASLPLDVNDVDHDGNTSEVLPLDARGAARIIGGTVDIGAVEQNVAPVAQNDGFATDEATNVNGDITADNGNGIDHDPDGDTLTVTKVDGATFTDGIAFTLASGAMLTMHSDGTFTYDSNDAFDYLPVGNVAEDSFTYTVADGNGGTDTATVTIDITGLDTNDTFIGTSGPDVFSGGVGNDTMKGLGGDDTLKGDVGQDTLTGGGGDDTLIGGSGKDVLIGGKGKDTLKGGKGDDTLVGGTGNDTLTGGSSSDTFVFDSKLNKHSNVDKITDFQVNKDMIWLDASIFGAIGTKLGKGEFHIGTKAHDANDHIIYDKTTGNLYYDEDGKGGAGQVQFATLDKGLNLSNHDFIVGDFVIWRHLSAGSAASALFGSARL